MARHGPVSEFNKQCSGLNGSNSLSSGDGCRGGGGGGGVCFRCSHRFRQAFSLIKLLSFPPHPP